MTKEIWKFPVSDIGYVIMQMPLDAEILTVQMQNEKAMIWAICDPSAEVKFRTFYVIGTGEPRNFEGLKYIGTYQQNELVWHLFEDAI
jgi:hypothetical protein